MYEYVFKILYKHKICYVLITARGGIVELFISLCKKEVKFYFDVLKDYEAKLVFSFCKSFIVFDFLFIKKNQI